MRLANTALALARRGWFVFPCRPGAKEPLTEHGFKDATRDPDQIDEWWTNHPNANIAVDCGRSELAVLDVDVKNDAKGEESLRTLFERLGPEAFATLCQMTPSGGRHYFYRGAVRSGKPLPGIDLKSIGGYVLVAPSYVGGKPYEWVTGNDKAEIMPLPADLMEAVIPVVKPALEIEEDTPIIAGARNDTLAKLAGRLRRQGFSAGEILALLQKANEQRCRPPIPDDEVRAIARSISRYDPAERIAPVQSGSSELLSIADMYERADEDVRWLVEGLLPEGGILLMSARPKVGKSELARNLGYAVATGGEFLGRRCQKGKVLWLAMEEQPSVITERLQAMQVPRDAVWLHKVGPAPADGMAWLQKTVEDVRPTLIVVDTLQRLAQIEDINNYSQVTRGTDALLRLSREFGVAQVWLHHNKKATDSTRGVLGSTALVGTVDTTMILSRNEDNLRFCYTEQRHGFDMEETALTMDPDTYRITAGDSKWLVEQRRAEQLILDVLRNHGSLTRAEIFDRVPRRASIVRSAMSSLLSAGFVEVEGRGVKGEAKKYRLGASQQEPEEPTDLADYARRRLAGDSSAWDNDKR